MHILPVTTCFPPLQITYLDVQGKYTSCSAYIDRLLYCGV
uniref:Uncharacterized protein n=1 Tax=Anguilla anguilla TaxID=7936 RepID=A0A0E9QSQ8_ANGAN